MESTRASRYNPWIDNGKNQTESKQNTVNSILRTNNMIWIWATVFRAFRTFRVFFECFAIAPGQKEVCQPWGWERERASRGCLLSLPLCLFPFSFSILSFTHLSSSLPHRSITHLPFNSPLRVFRIQYGVACRSVSLRLSRLGVCRYSALCPTEHPRTAFIILNHYSNPTGLSAFLGFDLFGRENRYQSESARETSTRIIFDH